ncbi:unnamed protein product [Closterium sp. NIES-54]
MNVFFDANYVESDAAKIRYAVSLLRGPAMDWWRVIVTSPRAYEPPSQEDGPTGSAVTWRQMWRRRDYEKRGGSGRQLKLLAHGATGATGTRATGAIGTLATEATGTRATGVTGSAARRAVGATDSWATGATGSRATRATGLRATGATVSRATGAAGFTAATPLQPPPLNLHLLGRVPEAPPLTHSPPLSLTAALPSHLSPLQILGDRRLFQKICEDTFTSWDVSRKRCLSRADISAGLARSGMVWGLPPHNARNAEEVYDKFFLKADLDRSGSVERAEFNVFLRGVFRSMAEELEKNPLVVHTSKVRPPNAG